MKSKILVALLSLTFTTPAMATKMVCLVDAKGDATKKIFLESDMQTHGRVDLPTVGGDVLASIATTTYENGASIQVKEELHIYVNVQKQSVDDSGKFGEALTMKDVADGLVSVSCIPN